MTDESKAYDETPGLQVQERRNFMKALAALTGIAVASPPLATLTRTAHAREPESANGSANQPAQVAPLPELPEAVAGEDLVLRMMRDLRRALDKPVEERRWAMVIDLRKCTGCNGCAVGCITENRLPPGIAYRPVMTETFGTYPNVGRRFVPRPCMQCDEPPCVPVCPVNATWKRPDGIVTIDYDKCIGCRYCITACPYTARSFDSGYFYSDFEGGERQPYEMLPAYEYGEARTRANGGSPIGNARKCHFCIHRIERGELPACVLSCMGRATYFGDMNDPKSLVSELIGQPNVMQLKKEMGIQPKVFYLT